MGSGRFLLRRRGGRGRDGTAGTGIGAGGPGTGLPVAADELDIDLGQVGPEPVLVAFEQHDVDIGVTTRTCPTARSMAQPPAIQ